MNAEDRLAIEELFARHWRAFDTGDAATWLATLTPDATYDIEGHHYSGQDQLLRWYQRLASDGTLKGRQHFTDRLILDPDDDKCAVESYIMETCRLSNGICTIVALGEYRDICVRVAGGWLFSERYGSPWSGG